MGPWFILLWGVLFVGALGLETSEKNATFVSVWPEGDPNRCLEMFENTKQKVKRFGVVPGLGWDNLRNVEASQAVQYTFHKCKLTNDGQYLIPDNVFTVALKRSYVQTSAEFIDVTERTSSLTSSTINTYSSLYFYGNRISGSYSADNIETKTKQLEQEAYTARVMLQYNRYESKLQVDPPLSPQFKSRLMSLAGRIELNQLEMAHYEAQLIVRDFGTHVLKSVTAGAALIKDDLFKREVLEDGRISKTNVLDYSRRSFNRWCGSRRRYNSRTTKSDSKETEENTYSDSVTESSIRAMGGPLMDPNTTSVSDWIAQLDTNLVPMDRSGDPLYYLITPHTLPELPEATAVEAAEYVRKAIQAYYEINVIPGCTNKNRTDRFSKFANIDDGSCSAEPKQSLSFGGSFQTCETKGDKKVINDPCDELTFSNVLTGKDTCPEGYEKKLLHEGSKLGLLESERHCKRCPTHRSRRYCSTSYKQANGKYSTYWCSPKEKGGKKGATTNPINFGGIFSMTINNILTNAMNCPEEFSETRMLEDIFVCVSNKITDTNIPFGGFFSCKIGNPLASGLKKCPPGFSKQLATVNKGCEIYYCVVSWKLSGSALPPLRRPPFMMKPAVPIVEDDRKPNNTLVMVDMEAETWMQNQEALNLQQGITEGQSGHPQGLSPGAAAAIAIVCTLVGVVALLAGFVLFKRYQQSKRSSGQEMTGSGKRSGNSYC
ncbi:hypothetical protein RRG08_064266 [Elysia crispata]|uniref:MACPF domain-containing protein n=1 Tax=Elysia crispata TaxID=231223 RepID=A0AAE1D1N7_9GAST|nr:hypothetical protein RRG08_064266 [Elysia crispata]